MKSVLRQLYEGGLSPDVQYTPKTNAYRKLHAAQTQHYDQLAARLKALNPPLDKELAAVVDEQLALLPIEMGEMFIDGFCLGARMMIEVYQKEVSDREE